jgi:hypothetical protein
MNRAAQDVTVTSALMSWVWQSKQNINKRRYWVYSFVHNSKVKNTSEDLILELSTDKEKCYSFTWMTKEIWLFLEHVQVEMAKKNINYRVEEACLLQHRS